MAKRALSSSHIYLILSIFLNLGISFLVSNLKDLPCCPVTAHLGLRPVGNLNDLVRRWAEAGAFSKVDGRGAKLYGGHGWRTNKIDLITYNI